jgi:hypothetical protein
MKHKSFSIEVPSVSENLVESRPLLCRFDKELEAHGYKTLERISLSDNPLSLPKAYTRTTETSTTMISDSAYLTFKTQQLIQQEKGKNYHTAGINGNISVCEEKDLEEFKQIVKSVFNIENLELNEVNTNKEQNAQSS